jgi:hypothetical protein
VKRPDSDFGEDLLRERFNGAREPDFQLNGRKFVVEAVGISNHYLLFLADILLGIGEMRRDQNMKLPEATDSKDNLNHRSSRFNFQFSISISQSVREVSFAQS